MFLTCIDCTIDAPAALTREDKEESGSISLEGKHHAYSEKHY